MDPTNVSRKLINIKYRIDGDIDFHDPANPVTTSCPFLPGQVVNVLDVPAQAVPPSDLGRRESDPMEAAVYTMDPRNKYLKPRPMIPSENRSRCPCPTASVTATEKNQLKSWGANDRATPLPTPAACEAKVSVGSGKVWRRKAEASHAPFKHSIFATYQRIRGTQSEVLIGTQDWSRRPETTKRESTVPSKPFCVSNHQTASAHDLSCVKHISQNLGWDPQATPMRIANSWSNPSFLDSHYSSTERPLQNRRSAYNVPVTLAGSRQELSAKASGTFHFRPLEPEKTRNSFAPEGRAATQSIPFMSAAAKKAVDVDASHTITPTPVDDAAFPGTLDMEDGHCLRQNGSHRKPSFSGSASSSYCTNENFSPGLAPNQDFLDALPQYHLSQPETPSISEYGEDLLESLTESESQLQSVQVRDEEAEIANLHGIAHHGAANMYDAAYPDFFSYQLPQPEQGSNMTLKTLPSNPLSTSEGHRRYGSKSIHDQVRSWNDGSEHRMTALEALVNDLGYLGELIN
jgi:hypothetical protein